MVSTDVTEMVPVWLGLVTVCPLPYLLRSHSFPSLGMDLYPVRSFSFPLKKYIVTNTCIPRLLSSPPITLRTKEYNCFNVTYSDGWGIGKNDRWTSHVTRTGVEGRVEQIENGTDGTHSCVTPCNAEGIHNHSKKKKRNLSLSHSDKTGPTRT